MRNITISLVALLAILPAAGAAGPKINAFTNIDWTKVSGTTAPTATCGSTIFGMPYTNTATGDFYVCGSSGWVLVTSGGGGSIGGSGTAGVYTKFVGAATVGNGSLEENSNPGLITSSKAIIINDGTGVAGIAAFQQGTAASNSTTSVTLTVPTSVTSYRIVLPGVHATSGNTILSCTAADPSVCTWVAGNTGSVTSVAQTVPSWLTVSGSPITASGTLAITATTGQTSHQVIGTCNAGTTFAPCSLVIGDLPTITAAKGGTGIDTSASTGVAQVSSGTWSVSTALANGTTATTQSAADNSTKVATTAYADAVLLAQYKKGSCTEVWVGSGTSNVLTTGDDAFSNNTCYNDSGVTRTITAVKCRSDVGSNTTTTNPTFGSAGTGTTILSGAVTCGSSLAYSSSGTVSNASWTTGTGINPVMGGTLTGTSIAMIVEYTF